jgi:hypothetical protein
MIPLDKQELQTIVILKRVPEFKQFIDILNKSLNALSLKNATVNDEILVRWNQGRIQELLDITKQIKSADEELHSVSKEARKYVV